MAKGKNVATQDEGSKAVATQGPRNNFQRFGAEKSNQTSIEGSLLKFTKAGEWTAGQDDDEIPEGTVLIMGINTLKEGWQKWEDGKPTESKIGLVSEGFRACSRDELGDQDEDEWEVDPQNKKQKRDPWQEINIVLLKNPETGDVFTYSTSSKSGMAALGEIATIYGNRIQDGHPEEEVPMVELKSTWYKHKTYGKIYTPVFELTDEWVTPESFKASDTQKEQAQKTRSKSAGKGSSGSSKASGANGRTAPKALPAPRKSQGGGNRARI